MRLRLGYKHGGVSRRTLGRQAQGIRLRYFSRDSGYRKQLACSPRPSLPGSMEDHLSLHVLWGKNKFPHQTEPADTPDLQHLNYQNFTRERDSGCRNRASAVFSLNPAAWTHMKSHPIVCLLVLWDKHLYKASLQPSYLLLFLPYLKFCPVHMASSSLLNR